MPKSLPWLMVGSFETQIALNATLSRYLHQLKIKKSQVSPCTNCPTKNMHEMRVLIKHCGSSRCKESGQQCTFQLKIVQCLETHMSRIYEIGSHVFTAEESSPKKPKIEGQLRSYIEEKIVAGKIPTQIHADITSNRANLGLSVSSLPTLKQIQGVKKRYHENDINENDRVDTLLNFLEGRSFDESLPENKPFYFGVELDEHGKPILGDGSDNEPFFLALSTKRLMRNVRIAADAGPVLIHADVTFKLAQTSFPLLALGVSDRCGTFHLVCLVLASNHNTSTWAKALQEIKVSHFKIIGAEMNVSFVMGDADGAQHTAFMDVFPGTTYLMCYFHVIKNIRDKCRGLSSRDYRSVMEDVNLLHYAPDIITFNELKGSIFRHWEEHQNNDFTRLKEYVDKSWLNTAFHRWQAFWTPCGFTATNNPVEKFNNTVKQTWTYRKKLKVPVLVQKLFELLEYNSIHSKIFQQKVVPTPDLLKRVNSLHCIGLLKEKAYVPSVTSTIYQGKEQEEETNIEPPLQSEAYAAKLVDSTISHFARWVEVKDMPPNGWLVSLDEKTCPCLYFQKFGTCVHLLFAMVEHNLAIPGLAAPPRTFVNRTIQRGRGGRGRGRGISSGRGSGRGVGRPPRVGAALSMT